MYETQHVHDDAITTCPLVQSLQIRCIPFSVSYTEAISSKREVPM